MKNEVTQICPICKRDTPEEFLERHHLVPKAKGGKQTVIACRNCGDMLHKLFSNNELRDKLNSLEDILANEFVRKWAIWAFKQKGFTICMKEKKKK